MRLINADILTEGIKKYFCNVCSEPEIGKCKACDIAEILSMIDDTPTAEVKNAELAAQIMQHYGARHQLIKLCEECGELIQQAAKCYDRDQPFSADFIEELADVQVLIMQFRTVMGTYWFGEMERAIDRKLRRQIERIESEAR